MLAICVEASHQRGLGHLYRAFALAEALRELGVKSVIYHNGSEAACRLLRDREQANRIVQLEDEDSNWEAGLIGLDGVSVWVNDRLDTRRRHASNVLAAGARLATFDDRGPGAALSMLNVVAFPADDERLPGRAVASGLSYLVLDPEIQRFRRERRELRSIVVSMGGADTYGLTIPVMRALRERGLTAVVVLGPAFAHSNQLDEFPEGEFVIKRGVPSLTAEFAMHDLAITAGGVTPCEATAAGLPCLIVAAEPWEVRTAEQLAASGGCRSLGERDRIDFSALDGELPLALMSRAAMAAVDGGGALRVARMLLSL